MLIPLLLILLWLSAIIYLRLRSHTDDDSPKRTILDRILRLYVCIFGLILLFYLFYCLIIILSSLRVVEV